VILHGVVIDIDANTGKATNIQRVRGKYQLIGIAYWSRRVLTVL